MSILNQAKKALKELISDEHQESVARNCINIAAAEHRQRLANQPHKFQKKPLTIEAILWTGENDDEVRDFTGMPMATLHNKSMAIVTLEGTMWAEAGDFIIKGIKGELYPCKPDIFAETYQEVRWL